MEVHIESRGVMTTKFYALIIDPGETACEVELFRSHEAAMRRGIQIGIENVHEWFREQDDGEGIDAKDLWTLLQQPTGLFDAFKAANTIFNMCTEENGSLRIEETRVRD